MGLALAQLGKNPVIGWSGRLGEKSRASSRGGALCAGCGLARPAKNPSLLNVIPLIPLTRSGSECSPGKMCRPIVVEHAACLFHRLCQLAELLLAVSCRVVGTRVHPQGRGDVESCRCHRCCRCCRCSPSRQPSLAAHHSETNVRRRISAFLRSKKLQYIPIGSEYSETADPPKLANSASIICIHEMTSPSLPLSKRRVLAPIRTRTSSLGPPFRPRGGGCLKVRGLCLSVG